MSNSIVVQVGQCGNQIGSRFWDMVLQEHARNNRKGVYDDALSTFFRNVDKYGSHVPLGDGKKRITGLKARGLMVDMEEGVVGQIRKSPLGELFDSDQAVISNSGSGNNWAVGNCVYGPMYREEILEGIRRQAEWCDSLQSFFMLGSLGGGTGSGLGSFICETLADEYSEVYRFYTTVMPSENDDVVTSPYNSILSLSKLIDTADCVLPIENDALLDIYEKVVSQTETRASARTRKMALTDNGDKAMGGLCGVSGRKTHPFDAMNNIAANLLMNMTSSMRFEGSMNVDINDIVTNLVPFPRLKFVMSSMTPLYTLTDSSAAPRRVDQMFLDAFSRDSQLIKADPKAHRYLACALVARGDVEISDIRRNIDKLSSQLKFASWNRESWKTGICSVPPLGQPRCLLALANNCGIRNSLTRLNGRFNKLYRRKANLHHYTEHIDGADIASAAENVVDVIASYTEQEGR
ncbi:Tubulin/FtsZ family, GTPase domain-containing protein [Fimicolochytrium jonesii]|uniref:Tubulin/FtsZ family, GTPase domain-containing protein n=1 Tax=Fimicolochytrium jonesii TaxID=1396493 RepID=UPI0022FE7025|nr:Tubulin/FtsZ family, GTPase domain-containing protein [Fimicolochytrium jonesii]KAI8825783.1 Tubulin/FtsZ family, GTPase domain-containing protein [Fimicolochytrium jonesii]